MIKIDPPRITGGSTSEQLQQVIRYLYLLTEQLNMELNVHLEQREE